MNCFSFTSVPLHSLPPLLHYSTLYSFHFILPSPSPPLYLQIKNINTGTSSTFPLYIFLPLQGKEVNCFSFASPPPPLLSLSFSLFIFSPFPLLPSQSIPSPLLPSALGLRLYPSNKSSRPASITLLSEVLYFVSIFLQVTHVNVFLF